MSSDPLFPTEGLQTIDKNKVLNKPSSAQNLLPLMVSLLQGAEAPIKPADYFNHSVWYRFPGQSIKKNSFNFAQRILNNLDNLLSDPSTNTYVGYADFNAEKALATYNSFLEAFGNWVNTFQKRFYSTYLRDALNETKTKFGNRIAEKQRTAASSSSSSQQTVAAAAAAAAAQQQQQQQQQLQLQIAQKQQEDAAKRQREESCRDVIERRLASVTFVSRYPEAGSSSS
jgi:hypothetical protein